MDDWEPLPNGVGWTSPPLFNFRATRTALEQRLGPPHARNLDSNGVGLYDGWALRFPCGLEITLSLFHLPLDSSGMVVEPSEPASIEVHANAAFERHILFHLPVPAEDMRRWEPSPLLPEALGWRLVRQDDNGVTFEIARYASHCEAAAALAVFESGHHKQTYWLEETPRD